MDRVWLFTDGSTIKNPGPGGWAYRSIDVDGGFVEGSGWETNTTNNRMELLAVVKGLLALEKPSEVYIHTDSAYVMNAFALGWISRWKDLGWTTAERKPVLNRDLWEWLDSQVSRHRVTWVKVKAHTGNEDNDAVDVLARRAAYTAAGEDPDKAKPFRRVL